MYNMELVKDTSCVGNFTLKQLKNFGNGIGWGISMGFFGVGYHISLQSILKILKSNNMLPKYLIAI